MKFIIILLISFLFVTPVNETLKNNNNNIIDTNNSKISDEFFLLDAGSHQWPMLGQNSCHTGLSLYETINNPGNLKWRYKTNGSIFDSSPVIANDGTIYVGCLKAINPDGTLKWELKTNNDRSSSPALDDDGNIYFESYNELYSVYSNGTIKWSFECEEKTHFTGCSPVIGPDGTIYILAETAYDNVNTYFYAFNPDGTLKWKFQTSPNVLQYSSPAVGENNIIYFCTDNHYSHTSSYFYALYPNGTIYWKYNISDLERIENINTPIIGFDGTIYFTVLKDDSNSLFIALNPDGTLKWKNNQLDYLYSNLAISSDGIIYVTEKKTLDNKKYGYLNAFNSNGTLKWSYKAESYYLSSPSIGLEGTIYVPGWNSDDIGCIYAIKPNGELKWKLNLDIWDNGAVYTQPAIGKDGTIYFGSYDGDLYAIGTSLDNKPPLKPVVTGPKHCLPYENVYITSYTTDPDGDKICYYFLYDDDFYWPERTIRRIPAQGYCYSGIEIKVIFQWCTYGVKTIHVKARDIHGYDSEESILKINTRARSLTNSFLGFLDQFSILHQILNRIK